MVVHNDRCRVPGRWPLWVAAMVCAIIAGLIAGCSSTPSPVGDPDPGHQLLDALRPVAFAVPGGVHVTNRSFVEPQWDSCDGQRSTYGWNPVTVDVGFDSNTRTDAAIVSRIRTRLHTLGWSYDAHGSSPGARYWTRVLPEEHTATIQLLGGSTSDPPRQWDMQATADAVTHPVTGC